MSTRCAIRPHTTPYDTLIPLIAILPLAGFVFTALFGRRIQAQYGKVAASAVPIALVGLAWVAAMIVAAGAIGGAAPFGAHGHGITFWEWIPAGQFSVSAGFFVDALTACLLIVVTTIGLLVHIYSLGYMSHDGGYWRFFAYLNLFMFSMLLLVLADNFLVIFLSWELVGLSSYLLIGFWFPRRSAALASKKAFIVNRVGDVGFILGIMLIWVNLHTLNVQAVLAGIGGLDHTTISWIALLILCGAVGKSAQFPLHVWLPDAMEGPTPVSALIHPATMVNAGVYLVARTSPIFARAPEIMVVVAAIGTFTAILAASIAFTQTDIKRVLAYSTLSQLGYMFAALGVGAWTAAIFHLMAHGFFKGLLFLGSGSVIHSVHDEQDMRKMGGLSKKIPITYWTMLIGYIGNPGVPPPDGFLWVWAIVFLVAGMTAFYMFRLIGLTFWGESRVDPAIEPNIHESGRAMTIPLILLAIPTIFIGLFLGLPFGASRLQGWLEPVFAPTVALANRTEQPFALFGIDGALILASVTVAAIGIVLAWRFFGVNLGPLRSKARLNTVSAIASANGATRFLYRASLNKWWFDELNDLLFIRIGGRIANGLWWFDRNVVDGAVNGTGRG